MFKLCIITVLVALTWADNIDKDAKIISYSNELNHDGTYQYSFSSSNGITANQQGVGGEYANGDASWITPEGTPIQLTYTADENGYQPKGDHLPTSPPIPDHVLRTLEYIRTHPSKEEYNTY